MKNHYWLVMLLHATPIMAAPGANDHHSINTNKQPFSKAPQNNFPRTLLDNQSTQPGNLFSGKIPNKPPQIKYPSIHSSINLDQRQAYKLANQNQNFLYTHGWHENNNYLANDPVLRTVTRCSMQIEWNEICNAIQFQPSQNLTFSGSPNIDKDDIDKNPATIPSSFKFWLPAGAIQLTFQLTTYQSTPMFVSMRKGSPNGRTSTPSVIEVDQFAQRFPIIPVNGFSRLEKLFSGDELLAGAEGAGQFQIIIAGDVLPAAKANPKGDWVYVNIYGGPPLSMNLAGTAVKSLFQAEYESISYDKFGDPILSNADLSGSDFSVIPAKSVDASGSAALAVALTPRQEDLNQDVQMIVIAKIDNQSFYKSGTAWIPLKAGDTIPDSNQQRLLNANTIEILGSHEQIKDDWLKASHVKVFVGYRINGKTILYDSPSFAF
ncbi:hypothetical protein [Chitinimonas sp.]|uniref:hypothetical protein n=1 Tax=Chitinimonas sp. TaxID=1934313 RepID=UPI0035ADAD1B